MIKGISQPGYVIPPVNSGRSNYSSANFTAQPNFEAQSGKNKQKENSHKVFWGALLLGAVGVATALIVKKIKANSELTKLKKEIETFYNKSWDDLMKYMNRDTNSTNLQIEKPNLKFFSTKNNETLGNYVPNTNDIELNLHHLKQDMYLSYNDTQISIASLEDLEKLRKDKVIDDSWTIKKLNDKEKVFVQAHVIAHEQRHCVQYHTVLNDINYGPEFLLKDKAKQIKESMPNLSQEELMKLAKKVSPYWVNFKPKGKLKNIKLLLPIRLKNGNEVYFTTESFARNISEYTSKDRNKYDMNSLEIDANIFACLYLKTNKPIQEGCDPKVIKTDSINKFV